MHAAGCALLFFYLLTQSVLVVQARSWNINALKNARMDTARFWQHTHAGTLDFWLPLNQ